MQKTQLSYLLTYFFSFRKGEPHGICWRDADGNEIEKEDISVGMSEVFADGNQLPFMALSQGDNIVMQS